MPYTPPSHRSPASSAPASPDMSRRSSLQSSPRPSLPRSASYLNKHRRTPSVTTVDGSAGSLTPQGTSEDLPALAAGIPQRGSGSVRQSPVSWSREHGIPQGAVISPPDSASSGSDDETTLEIRGRKLEKLKHLRDAVIQMPHAKTPSHTPCEPSNADAKPRSQLDAPAPGPMHISLSTSVLGDLHNPSRRASHVRSATEPNAVVIHSADNSLSASEEDTDEDLTTKPQMVRKKSGELVRPALRPSSRRRPSSMPGTPVFSKAVHFDSHLEHVRHFLQVDRPLAVSAGSSPVDTYESDNEYPFPSEAKPAVSSPPYEWEILTPGFPHDSHIRRTLPVKLEKLWLSSDQKTLLGYAAVANLAFQKHISCRFTLDYWKTTSEVTAEYTHAIRPQETPTPYDRFSFSIKLSDTANLESKTLYLCVRYSVNGQEYWDNNASANFQVDFRKKHLPQNGKNNFRGATGRSRNALPRSNRRQNSSIERPKSMPASLQEFGSEGQYKFGRPLHENLGDSGITSLRLKTKSCSNIAKDNIAGDHIANGLSSPSGVAFANRYDFGASLSAAVHAAKDFLGKEKDTLYMKDNVRGTRYLSESRREGSPPQLFSSPSVPSGGDSPVPSLPSASYEELVNKYCFFGSKPSAPAKVDKMKSERPSGTTGSSAISPSRAVVSVPYQGPRGYAQESPDLQPGANSPSPTYSPQLNYFTVAGGESAPSSSSATSTLAPLAFGFAPVVPPASGEVPYPSQQHVLPEPSGWRCDTCTTPTIRG